MKPNLKQIKIWVSQCPNCKDILSEDGNFYDPYKCSCGKWQYDFRIKGYKIKIK